MTSQTDSAQVSLDLTDCTWVSHELTDRLYTGNLKQNEAQSAFVESINKGK